MPSRPIYKPIVSDEELRRQDEELKRQHEFAELERIRIENEAKGVLVDSE